ncbi:hypothetical protein Plano_0783 [Planococcus sp. PAMC 21323]|nr:hypothetical protein Plano_0783 [Planococcus sp. PAMC 21323]
MLELSSSLQVKDQSIMNYNVLPGIKELPQVRKELKYFTAQEDYPRKTEGL